MASSKSGGISNTAFQEALLRAKQLAAKITQQSTGKRPAEDVVSPDPKRVAAYNDPIGAQLAAMKQQSLTRPSKSSVYTNGIIINGEKTLDIMIPGSKVGYVIGKGGEMIRNLQERAGVKMTVFQESNEATENDKQLRIIGEIDKVDYAKQLVTDLLTEKEIETIRLKTSSGIKPVTNDYGTMRHGACEVPVPPQYIGLVIGKGGESIRRIQQETQCKVQFDTTKSDANGNKVCSIAGPPDAMNRAVEMVKEIIDNAMHGRRPREGDEVRMPIPAYRTGAVIGRGGETIRTIKQQSGCDIELEKNTKGGSPDEKYFIIRGPPDKISVAQQLILERVNGTNTSTPTSSSPGISYNELQQQWTNYWQSGNETTQSSDESKSQDANAAQWAAYYAQVYAQSQTPQGNNGTPAAAAAPSAESIPPPDQNQQSNQDYTNQWIEYYRAYGMYKEAEMLEQMAKTGKQPGDNSKTSDKPENCNPNPVPPVAYPGYNYSNYGNQSQQ